MPRGTELEEPCLWGPRQAHFTDGEREALSGGGGLSGTVSKSEAKAAADQHSGLFLGG